MKLVMAGLDPASHVFRPHWHQNVDARDIGERKRRRPADGYAGHNEAESVAAE
jgi:hypothetical protein